MSKPGLQLPQPQRLLPGTRFPVTPPSPLTRPPSRAPGGAAAQFGGPPAAEVERLLAAARELRTMNAGRSCPAMSAAPTVRDVCVCVR